jgi:NADPH2:quinone reductase
MRAFQLSSFDGPDGLALVEIDDPVADERGVLIDVRAVGVNFPDLLATRGEYQRRPELPYVPGCEIAGVVAAAPAGSALEVGDRVAAFTWDSGYAERAVVDVAGVIGLPDEVDFEEGAAMVVNYNTAHFALARRGQIKAGDEVLVLGAAGGVGTAAVQVARGLGAHVIGGVASEAQQATAAAAGAHETVILGDQFAAEVVALSEGRGVDLVFDPLGDRLFDEAIRALAPEGRILVVGFAAGEIPLIKVNRLLLRNAAAVGVFWGAFLDADPNLLADTTRVLDRLYAEGHVRPQINLRLPFDDLPSALARLGRGEIAGKAVAYLQARTN